MKSAWTGFRSTLASHIEAFLAFKRALGCLFQVEEGSLRLLDRFLVEQQVASRTDVTPEVIDAFLTSRPRAAPRSYNHLRGTVARLFDWMVAREMMPRSPVRSRPRRVIRQTKFSKSRLVPFGPHLATVLCDHLRLRAHQTGALTPELPVFSLRAGRPVSSGTISQTFHHLVPRLGLALPAGTAPPRAHDLRHAFAVGTLLRWYRSGIDPQAKLLHLSTFLGHVDPTSTAVYLTITRALLDEAGRRFESWAGPVIE